MDEFDDSCNELDRINGFRQMSGAPYIQALLTDVVHCMCGECDYWLPITDASQLVSGRVTVHLGHLKVH